MRRIELREGVSCPLQGMLVSRQHVHTSRWQSLTRGYGAKHASGIFRVDYVTVGVDGGMTVVFRDGTAVSL